MANKKNDPADIVVDDGQEIKINGMPFTEAAVLAMPNGKQLWGDGLASKAKIAGRDSVRKTISREVADPQAILGTTADVTQLNAAAVLALISAFEKGDTFPKFRAAFMGTIEALVPPVEGSGDVYAQAQTFLAGVQSGDIILTAAMKGLPKVIGEMAARSTGVANILIAAQISAQAKAQEAKK